MESACAFRVRQGWNFVWRCLLSACWMYAATDVATAQPAPLGNSPFPAPEVEVGPSGDPFEVVPRPRERAAPQPSRAEAQEKARQAVALLLARYEERLSLYFAARRDWLFRNGHVSAAELEHLQALSQESVRVLLLRAQTPETALMGRFSEADFIPSLFARETSQAAQAGDQLERDASEREWIKAPTNSRIAAGRERTRFRREAFRDLVVGLLDRELMLTTPQRELVAREWNFDTTEFDCGLFTCYRGETYYPQQPTPSSLPESALSQLLPQQKAVLRSVWKRNPPVDVWAGESAERYLTLAMDDWSEQLDQAAIKYRETLLQTLAIHVHFYTQEYKLTEATSLQVELMGKQVIIDLCKRWKDGHLLVMQRSGKIHYLEDDLGPTDQNAFRAEGIRQAALWSTNLSKLVGHDMRDPNEPRRKWHRQIAARSTLAMLDQELWLDPPQREKLFPLIDAALTSASDLLENPNSMREIFWIVQTLVKVDEAEVQKILTPAQHACWARMRSHFPPSPRKNSYLIPIDRSSTATFQLFD